MKFISNILNARHKSLYSSLILLSLLLSFGSCSKEDVDTTESNEINEMFQFSEENYRNSRSNEIYIGRKDLGNGLVAEISLTRDSEMPKTHASRSNDDNCYIVAYDNQGNYKGHVNGTLESAPGSKASNVFTATQSVGTTTGEGLQYVCVKNFSANYDSKNHTAVAKFKSGGELCGMISDVATKDADGKVRFTLRHKQAGINVQLICSNEFGIKNVSFALEPSVNYSHEVSYNGSGSNMKVAKTVDSETQTKSNIEYGAATSEATGADETTWTGTPRFLNEGTDATKFVLDCKFAVGDGAVTSHRLNVSDITDNNGSLAGLLANDMYTLKISVINSSTVVPYPILFMAEHNVGIDDDTFAPNDMTNTSGYYIIKAGWTKDVVTKNGALELYGTGRQMKAANASSNDFNGVYHLPSADEMRGVLPDYLNGHTKDLNGNQGVMPANKIVSVKENVKTPKTDTKEYFAHYYFDRGGVEGGNCNTCYALKMVESMDGGNKGEIMTAYRYTRTGAGTKNAVIRIEAIGLKGTTLSTQEFENNYCKNWDAQWAAASAKYVRELPLCGYAKEYQTPTGVAIQGFYDKVTLIGDTEGYVGYYFTTTETEKFDFFGERTVYYAAFHTEISLFAIDSDLSSTEHGTPLRLFRNEPNKR